MRRESRERERGSNLRGSGAKEAAKEGQTYDVRVEIRVVIPGAEVAEAEEAI